MTEHWVEIARQWVDNEDKRTRDARVERLAWFASMMPVGDHLAHAGSTAHRIFEGARYCFAYGQFLAATTLGLAYIEHTLASDLYAGGCDEPRRAPLARLAAMATDAGLISESQAQAVDRLRSVRNAIHHFRLLGPDTVEYRAVMEDTDAYSVIEDDAREVMAAMVHFVRNWWLNVQARALTCDDPAP